MVDLSNPWKGHLSLYIYNSIEYKTYGEQEEMSSTLMLTSVSSHTHTQSISAKTVTTITTCIDSIT